MNRSWNDLIQKNCCWVLFKKSQKKLCVFVLHHRVTLVCFLKCLRGCQNVFSEPPKGTEEWLAKHTASRASLTFPQMLFCLCFPCLPFCPSPTIFHLLWEDQFCFQKNFYSGLLFHSDTVQLSPLSVWLGVITWSLLFDLAPFNSEFPFYLPCNLTR